MIPSEKQFDDGGGGSSTPAAPLAPTALASQESGAIGASSMNRDSSRAASPVAGVKAPKTIDKSNWNKNVKVSQTQVDNVKNLGRGNMGKNAVADLNKSRTRVEGFKSSPGAGDITPRMANQAEREATKRIYPKAYAQGATSPNKRGGGMTPSAPAAKKSNWRTEGLFPGALGGQGGNQSWRTEGLFPGALGGKKK